MYLIRYNFQIKPLSLYHINKETAATYNSGINKMTTSKPIELDFLIVGNRLKPKIEQILDCVHPHNIIVDKSVSKWSTDNIRKVCKDRGIRFYAIAEQGAYELDIKD